MICPDCFKNAMDNKKCSECGYELDFSDSSSNLKMFSLLRERYLIGRAIGAGGFGITYSAYDTVNDIRVCVKEYFPLGMAVRASDGIQVYCTRSNIENEYRHGISNFMSEAEIISDLNNISGIVNISDHFEENGTAYYVMEHLDGVSLFSMIPFGGMNKALADDIIKKVGKNLDIVHKEKGYLHRDISPENIMILPTGRVVIIDFGSAKSFFLKDSNYTITLKHGFAPIEQYSEAGRQGPFTDLYALAATYYYMLTAIIIPPATERLRGAGYIPLCKIRNDVTEEASEAVDMALAIEPKDRLRTVGDFLDLLEHSQNDEVFSERKHYLTVSVDGETACMVNVEDDRTVVIGRSQKCDIVIENCESISKTHCTVTYDSIKQQFCIEDYSTNGTYVNYVRIEKGVKYFVGNSDLIVLANTRCRLILEDDDYVQS